MGTLAGRKTKMGTATLPFPAPQKMNQQCSMEILGYLSLFSIALESFLHS